MILRSAHHPEIGQAEGWRSLDALSLSGLGSSRYLVVFALRFFKYSLCCVAKTRHLVREVLTRYESQGVGYIYYLNPVLG